MSNNLYIYKYNRGNWTKQGYGCYRCKKLFARETNLSKHICTPKIKEEEFVPIHKTEKGYYWGSKGPFPTREKAEEVAKAAYAHGYKEKQDTKKKK